MHPAAPAPLSAEAALMQASAATTRRAPLIQPIDQSSIHRICSGQVILDLATAVKELLENSLDAGASSVTLSLQGYGATAVEVSDNGAGVRPECYESLALKHWTSKLRSFGDLGSVRSFGFRGEALSSLCALAGKVVVTTRCEGEPMATQLTYSSEGVLVGRAPASRTVGTTVTLSNLFASLPVRHKVFVKNIKREYGKMLQVVQSYALLARGVRIHVYNTSSSGTAGSGASRTLVLSTQGSIDVRELITNVFGAKQAAALQEVDTRLESNEQFKLNSYSEPAVAASSAAASSSDSLLPASAAAASVAASSTPAAAAASSSSLAAAAATPVSPFRLRGFVSRVEAKCGRSAPDRQFFFVNSRPVDLPRLARLVNDAYRACNAQTSYPCVVLNLLLPHGSFDVNLTPNKRETMLHDEAALLGLIKSYFQKLFEPSMYTYQVKSLEEFGIRSSATAAASASQTSSQRADSPTSELLQDSAAEEDEDGKQQGDSDLDMLSPASASPVSAGHSSPRIGLTIGRTPSSASEHAPSLHTPARAATAASISAPRSADSVSAVARAAPAHALGSAPQLRTHAAIPPSGRPARPLTQLLQSLPAGGRAPGAYAAALQPLSAPPLRHQSTPSVPPAASTTSSSVRSSNSFLNAFARRGSGSGVATPKWQEEPASAPALADSLAAAAADKGELASLDRAAKRPRMDDEQPAMPSGLQRMTLSRQATLLLPRSSSPPRIAASFSSDEHGDAGDFSPSPDLSPPDRAEAIDLFSDTDIGIEYRVTAAQRSMHVDLDALERWYTGDIAEELVPADGNASLLHRAETILSPTAAASSSVSAAASLGASAAPSAIAAASSLAAAAPRVLSEQSMRRVIDKADFKAMRIVGQFNLGFIITRLNQDLFIIDQHATDEKYRFELLSASTTMNSQPLLNPLPLDCTPSMQVVMREHKDVFLKNGFDLLLPPEEEDERTRNVEEQKECSALDDHTSSDAHHSALMQSSRSQVRVRTLPFSKNVTFGAEDIYELCAMLTENPSGMVRLPKVTSMLASRACRSAVMIGTALNHAKMSSIVEHMSALEHPWACPHGRPTMRHLFDLSQLESHEALERQASGVTASPIEEAAHSSPPPTATSSQPCCAH